MKINPNAPPKSQEAPEQPLTPAIVQQDAVGTLEFLTALSVALPGSVDQVLLDYLGQVAENIIAATALCQQFGMAQKNG